MKKSIIIFVALLFANINLGWGSVKTIKPTDDITSSLLKDYMRNYPSKKGLAILKKKTLSKSAKAVPALIKVMKSSQYPEKNRWVATFLLGQIMGKKSAPFISKFIKHPNWVMRMASLKTLMALKQKKYTGLYAKALSDKSLIVRTQALDLVRRLNIRSMGPNVWSMLYDKRNYYQSKKQKNKKRTGIIKTVVRTVGDLKFQKAAKPLLTMVQKKKYEDIFSEMDYALGKILGKKSPKGSRAIKRRFWKRTALSHSIL